VLDKLADARYSGHQILREVACSLTFTVFSFVKWISIFWQTSRDRRMLNPVHRTNESQIGRTSQMSANALLTPSLLHSCQWIGFRKDDPKHPQLQKKLSNPPVAPDAPVASLGSARIFRATSRRIVSSPPKVFPPATPVASPTAPKFSHGVHADPRHDHPTAVENRWLVGQFMAQPEPHPAVTGLPPPRNAKAPRIPQGLHVCHIAAALFVTSQ
jgi:hypothetical protein